MSQATIRPSDVVQSALKHPRLFVVPVVGVTLFALVFALVRPNTWEAAQALVVRDEAGDRLTRPGKFAHNDEMKITQETILELAKSRDVLQSALEQVGPPANHRASTPWPNAKALEGLQSSIKLTPPKGAEFGKTEIFYIKVRDTDRQRAIELASAICQQLQHRFGALREARASSTIAELTRSQELARQDLSQATTALSELEQRVGSDLAELRILNELPSGDSDMRRNVVELEKELRACRTAQIEQEELHRLLTEALENPEILVAIPNVLLKSQPALGRLKDGLVDAQLRTGQTLGTMSEEHPLTIAARTAEQAIRKQLHNEISVAIRGVEVDLRVNADHISTLQDQINAVNQRLVRLAGVRAEYGNLVTAVKRRSETIATVEHKLSEARATQAAAGISSLIAPVGSPDTGTRPLGPGKSATVLAGFGGGVLIALAILFLTATPNVAPTSEPRNTVPAQVAEVAERNVGLTLKQALQRVTPNGI